MKFGYLLRHYHSMSLITGQYMRILASGFTACAI